MYRVFEALDELVQTMEQAYGVPMTSNCMVPRNEMLALLDDLRNALPGDLDDAQDHATRLVSGAEEESNMMITRARDIAETTINSAQREADHLVETGNEEYQRSVDQGLKEQKRLISESEVMRRADEEAHRLVEDAHAESSRLRAECDDYVDSKLAEFEETLNTVLRTVSTDRSALRRGAGVSGADRARRGQGEADEY